MSDGRTPLRAIGGADIGALMGINPFKGPRAVYYRVFGLTEDVDKPCFEWGRRLEGTVAKRFEDDHDEMFVLDTTGPQKNRTVYACGEPDRIGVNPLSSVGETLCIIEIKTANAYASDHWGPSGTGADGVPTYIVAQLMWYMWQWGVELGYVAVLIGGQDYREYEIDYDSELVARMKQTASEFWDSYIVPVELPPLGPNDEAPEASMDDGAGYITANGHQEQLMTELRAAEQQKAEAISAHELVKERVKEAIGQARGVIALFGEASYAANKKGVRAFRTKWNKEQ